MSRYSPQQLKHMACTVVMCDAHEDPRALQLYITIAITTGLDANAVRAQIQEMANA
jgi:hypothetical protein